MPTQGHCRSPRLYCLWTSDADLNASESGMAILPTGLRLVGSGGDKSWTLGSGHRLFLQDPALVRSPLASTPSGPQAELGVPSSG